MHSGQYFLGFIGMVREILLIVLSHFLKLNAKYQKLLFTFEGSDKEIYLHIDVI
jgi:hypothetical protein